MATSLALPLDDWVGAAARPVQLDALNASSEPGIRRDYSKISPEDAFPLLIQACGTRFGNLEGLDFNVKVSPGPLAYSATLTITGPDEIGIEFPHSGYHATRIQAKTHAAHRAVQQGAIEFIMQSDVPEPTAPASASNLISAGAPPTNPTPNPVASTSTIQPAQLAPPAPPKPAPTPKSNPTLSGPQSRPPINLINSVLQRAYNSNRVPLSKTSQTWDLPNYLTGVAARLTIKLPSGRKRSYGAVPGDNITGNAQTRPRVYATTKIAKESVAALAIESGVLDWIRSEESPMVPTARKTLATLEPARPTGDAPLPSNHQAGPSSRVQPLGSLPEKSSFLLVTSAKSTPSQDINTGALKRTADKSHAERETLREELAELHRETLETQNTATISSVDEAQAVDQLLGSPISSRPASPKLKSAFRLHPPRKPAPKETAPSENEDERSVAMDLETDAGSIGQVTPAGRRLSVEVEAVQEDVDEPPRKRQRTERPDALSGKSTNPEESKVMEGESYSKILSDYCLEFGRPQPQITYQRHRVDASEDGPVNYHVSLVVGSARYELSKNYEKVEEAEEKLSKRILKLFGVKPKKLRVGEA